MNLGELAAEKLKTSHEITRSGTKKEPLVRVISCAFVDRLILSENGRPFFSSVLDSQRFSQKLSLLGLVNRVRAGCRTRRRTATNIDRAFAARQKALQSLLNKRPAAHVFWF